MIKNITFCILLLSHIPAFPLESQGSPVTEDNKPLPAASTVPDKATAEDNTSTENKNAEDINKIDDKKFRWIYNTLEYGTHKNRSEAVNSILGVKNEEHKKILIKRTIELLKTEINSDVKIRMISLLGETGSEHPEAVKVLIERLDDQSDEVKTAAVYALKNINAAEASAKMIEMIKAMDLKENSNLAQAIIIALADLKASGFDDFAAETIKNTKNHPGIRERMVLFLGTVQSAASKELLLGIYEDENEDLTLRAYAVNSLAKMKAVGTAEAANRVLKSMDSYSFEKRKKYYNLSLYSITALAGMGDENVLPRLMDALRSDNTGVRLKAIELISDFENSRVKEILEYKKEHDPEARVRNAAAKALEKGNKSQVEKPNADSPGSDEAPGADKNKPGAPAGKDGSR